MKVDVADCIIHQPAELPTEQTSHEPEMEINHNTNRKTVTFQSNNERDILVEKLRNLVELQQERHAEELNSQRKQHTRQLSHLAAKQQEYETMIRSVLKGEKDVQTLNSLLPGAQSDDYWFGAPLGPRSKGHWTKVRASLTENKLEHLDEKKAKHLQQQSKKSRLCVIL